MKNLYESVFDVNIFKRLEVNDVLFTEYKCLEEESVFDIWSHINYFVYVLNGKKKWKTMTNEYMVYKDEAIFVRKGANIIHKFFEEDFCAIIIFVPDHFIKDIFQNYPVNKKAQKHEKTDDVIPITMDHTLSSYFQSLFSYFVKENPPLKDLLEIKFRELIITLANSPENHRLCQYFRSLCNTSKTSLRETMESNFAYNLGLDEYARMCGRSLSTFKRDFKALYNISPGKWLSQKRLEYSKYLLETTDMNINEVVFSSGFENASHFVTAFKKEFGTTPLKYKKITT